MSKNWPNINILRTVVESSNVPYREQILQALDIFGPDATLYWFSAGRSPHWIIEIRARFQDGGIEATMNSDGYIHIWGNTFKTAADRLLKLADQLPNPEIMTGEGWLSVSYQKRNRNANHK